MLNFKTSLFHLALPAILVGAQPAWSGPIPAPAQMSIPIDMSPPSLGTAYDSQTKMFYSSCVEGSAATVSRNPLSDLKASISSDYQDVTKSLGLEVGGRFRYGVVEASASAKFARTSIDTGYTVNLVYQSNASYKQQFDTGHGNSIQPKANFKSLIGGDPKPFYDICGDEYVNSLTQYASLLVKISVNFSSSEAAESFAAEMKVSSPNLDVAAKLNNASKKLDKHSRVDVSVLQIGGNPSLSGQALCEETFTSTTPQLIHCGDDMVSCGFGDFNKCIGFLKEVINYSAGNFPKQLTSEDKQPVNYATNFVETMSYKHAGPEYPDPIGDQENKVFEGELKDLSQTFEGYLKQWLFAERAALDGVPRLSERQRNVMMTTASSLNNLVKELSVEIEGCYSKGFESCHESASNIDKTIAGYLKPIEAKSGHKIATPSELEKMITDFSQAESFSQYCDMADERHAPVKYAIDAIDAWIANKDKNKFDAMSQGDKCDLEEKYLADIEEMEIDSTLVEHPYRLMDVHPFATLANLKILEISGAHVQEAGPLAQLKNLRVLNLANNELTDVCALHTLENLKKLNVSNNQLTSVECLANQRSLLSLDLRSNPTIIHCPLLEGRGCKNEDLSQLINHNEFPHEFDGPTTGASAVKMASAFVLVTGGERMDVVPTVPATTPPSYAVANRKSTAIFVCSLTDCEVLKDALKEPRSFHTETLLDDGTVLIVGGGTKTLEIYNDTTRQTELLKNTALSSPRSMHTATKLPGGKVLIVGGYEQADSTGLRSTPPVSTFEVYDMKTRLIERHGTLQIGRAEHTATLLADGRVLIVGGYQNSGMVGQMEIIDPKAGYSIPIGGRLKLPRSGHVAIPAEGKLFVAGGFVTHKDNAGVRSVRPTDTIEILDLKSMTFVTSEEKLSRPRGGMSSVQLFDSRWLIIGGTGSPNIGQAFSKCDTSNDNNLCPVADKTTHVSLVGGDSLASTAIDIFDPVSEGFYTGGELAHARAWMAIAPVEHGERTMLVFGGSGPEVHQNSSVESIIYR